MPKKTRSKKRARIRQHSDITERLKLIRRHFAGDEFGAQTAFALSIGVHQNHWNNLERGFPVATNMAWALVDNIPGLDFGYIYQGLTGNLSKELKNALTSRKSSPAKKTNHRTKKLG